MYWSFVAATRKPSGVLLPEACESRAVQLWRQTAEQRRVHVCRFTTKTCRRCQERGYVPQLKPIASSAESSVASIRSSLREIQLNVTEFCVTHTTSDVIRQTKRQTSQLRHVAARQQHRLQQQDTFQPRQHDDARQDSRFESES